MSFILSIALGQSSIGLGAGNLPSDEDWINEFRYCFSGGTKQFSPTTHANWLILVAGPFLQAKSKRTHQIRLSQMFVKWIERTNEMDGAIG